MTRTGLAAEVPTLDLCREMAAIPALAEAFKDTDAAPLGWNKSKGLHICDLCGEDCIPAPTVRSMLLVWLEQMPYERIHMDEYDFAVRLDGKKYDITDPDALARACIEAAR